MSTEFASTGFVLIGFYQVYKTMIEMLDHGIHLGREGGETRRAAKTGV